ncbi:MAG: hypothetical protein ABI758_02285 [Candidatus Woesebacteria bacterium]
MLRYAASLIERVRQLRAIGKTYSEIKADIKLQIPKSTLSEWCKHVDLPVNYQSLIDKLNINNLGKARATAVVMNKIRREKFFSELVRINTPTARKVIDKDTAKIALAMLCLGEASKYKSKSGGFSLGNTDPRIVLLFLRLLRYCFSDFQLDKVHCSVQCRADQDISALEAYWQKTTGIPKANFYKALVDPRTFGKPTMKKGYKGVLRTYYLDTKVQLSLESLADLTYNQVLLM